MDVLAILKQKSRPVYTVNRNQTVDDAVNLMVAKKVSALIDLVEYRIESFTEEIHQLKDYIDDHEYDVEEGMTVLQAARANGYQIPTLCYHPSLRPSGSCRLCAVEVPGRSTGKPVTMLSCVLKVKEGLVVKTHGEAVNRARTKAFKNLLQMAPQAKNIVEIARAYDIDPGPPSDGCIRCRLCIRVCQEIVGPAALKMEKRNRMNYVVPVEGLCIGCGTCAKLFSDRVKSFNSATRR
jgi:predicted molibdopterin-dependent oxidoreductase YjgC